MTGGQTCSADFCYNHTNRRTVAFFRVPKDSERSHQWLINSNRRDLIGRGVEYMYENIKFCADHFEEQMFMNEKKQSLTPKAAPTLFIWEDEVIKKMQQLDKVYKEERKEKKKANTFTRVDAMEEKSWMLFMQLADKKKGSLAWEFHGEQRRSRKDVRLFVQDMGMVPKRRKQVTLDRVREARIKDREERKRKLLALARPLPKKTRKAAPAVIKEIMADDVSILEDDFEEEEVPPQERGRAHDKIIGDEDKEEEEAEDESETLLYDQALIDTLDFSALTCFKPHIKSPMDLDERFRIRPLSSLDYDKGFLDLLGTLAKVGSVTKVEFQKRFFAMKQNRGTYYVTVLEDTKDGRIVGTGTLLCEKKFIRDCATRGLIEDVAVSSQYQGKQFGKVIVATLLELGGKLGCYKVSITCSEQMTRFYSALGFLQEEGNSSCLSIRMT